MDMQQRPRDRHDLQGRDNIKHLNERPEAALLKHELNQAALRYRWRVLVTNLVTACVAVALTLAVERADSVLRAALPALVGLGLLGLATVSFALIERIVRRRHQVRLRAFVERHGLDSADMDLIRGVLVRSQRLIDGSK